MVSIEERMIQKDKETAVLKANYKQQILLNIRLDKIEKCKKTYESFHSFEVAVMNRRRDRILRTQSELKRMKVKMAKNALDSEFDSGSFNGNVQDETNSVEMMKSDHVMEKSKASVYTQLNSRRANVVQVPKGSRKGYIPGSEKHIKEPFFAFSRSRVNGGTKRHDASLVARDVANLTHETKDECREYTVKFPGLTSPPRNATQHQDPRSPDAVRTSTFYSRDITNYGKSKHRDTAEDNMSPFQRFRLKLQESEERSWKCKVPLRSISAVDAMRKGSVMSEVSTIHRRSYSAVIQ